MALIHGPGGEIPCFISVSRFIIYARTGNLILSKSTFGTNTRGAHAVTWNTRLRMPETLSCYLFMAIFIHSTL